MYVCLKIENYRYYLYYSFYILYVDLLYCNIFHLLHIVTVFHYCKIVLNHVIKYENYSHMYMKFLPNLDLLCNF